MSPSLRIRSAPASSAPRPQSARADKSAQGSAPRATGSSPRASSSRPRAGGPPEPGARLRCPTCLAPFRAVFSRCPRDGSALVWSVADPLIGATIADRYVIEALVGEGAMGLVYRAHHARLSRLFALKLMFGDVAAEPAMRMRFAQEADSASRLCHPNVVSVCDFGRTDRGLLYLAMDYVDGETLASLIRREGPLEEARVVALARQLARGLGHAHRAGLVHRDFKPANIAVAKSEDGGELVRVLDFGLAISEREGDRIGRLTEHGLVVGTPIYISPEQAKDLPVDHRADLFALGVVLYEMLAGRPPFEGTGPEIARANVTQRPPTLSQRNPSVRITPELEQVVFRLLEKRAGDRYQTAEEVVAALDRVERTGVDGRAAGVATTTSRSPVLWLSGRSTRRWVPQTVPPPSTAMATAAPYPMRSAQDQAVPDDPETWDSERDAQPTVGMTVRATHAAAPSESGARRGVTTAAWFALVAASVVVFMTSSGMIGTGGRPATAAVATTPIERTPPPVTDIALSPAQLACAVDLIGSLSAAAGLPLFEGKMDAAWGARCTVPNAAQTGAGSRQAQRVPRAARRSPPERVPPSR